MHQTPTFGYQSEPLIFDQEDTALASTVTCHPGIDHREAEQASTRTGVSEPSPTRGRQGTQPRPLSEAQRAFAQGLLRGETAIKAFRLAYPNDGSNDASAATSASRLKKHPQIAKMLREEDDIEALIDDQAATRRFVFRQLLTLCRTARQEGSRLKAAELLGRSAGMFQVQPSVAVAEVSAIQLKRELDRHLHLLENVPKESVDVSDIKLLQHGSHHSVAIGTPDRLVKPHRLP